jgi:tight adherence protein C
MILVAVIALILIGLAVALVTSAVLEPRIRRSENLSQIEAYGYTGSGPAAEKAPRHNRASLDDLANWMGDLVSGRFITIKEDEIQRELISAGYYRLTARRFVGYKALLAIALPVLIIWLLALAGSNVKAIVLLAIIGFVAGWFGPSFFVHRQARKRLQLVDEFVPSMIDLLVVTLEAGVAFPQALRLAAERIEGPLGDELRLTVQEQALGLSVLESLENWVIRCNTVTVRGFVRALVQGDKLGVSIGQILRNQAVEVRARQRAMVQERAQKAPIKMLFPLVFLIFPAMFVIILGPAAFELNKVLGSAGG